ncbi:geranylgeranyl diphosphate synthase, type I [Saccharopolyspora antimicrobica]|uniref:Geranylgeranyl diphosphate synthase type I n=1 Tax=Saccharopolyspora antimicrobica TaxID=455193 RepID=A0A1I5JBM3_9PSEU|nr:polyprenyl synthetase family protein [Saccharopolyspora antimicrobica]RKT82450.1 geranylgeranyl diphosphate synthase type I [Saccharopolyspora antimicrobica]SFO70040.1 geranylgeranyl diphosphate synthase, type I [Saccharopolyspora antimicrobica]
MESSLPDQVQRELTEFLRARRTEAAELDPAFGAAVAELADFVLSGGKRIRPTFAWWGWRAAGGSDEGPAAIAMLRAASALELLQACALVHDDLIDESDTRRGNPTVHRKFEQVHQESGFAGDDRQFGMAGAVLLGDLALSWADDMLHSAGIPPAALNRALRPWRAMRTEVLAGQYLDVLGQVRGDESPQAALRICQLKAASYTVQRPLEVGAEIAGASPAALEALRRFGSDIGVAFQLRDDLLGVFGDPEVTGKPAGDDLREGKRTLLIAEAAATALKQGDQEALDLLHGVLGDPDLDEQRVEQARQLLTRLGAVAAVEKQITDLTGSALLALHGADLAEPAASRLAELAVAVTDRTR